MIERQEATSTLTRCDFPRCDNECRTFAAGLEMTHRPEGWQTVWDGDHENYFVLCPDHAHHADTVRLFEALIHRHTEALVQRVERVT